MTIDNLNVELEQQQGQERFEFVADRHNGLFWLLLVDKAELAAAQPVEPLYAMVCKTAEQWHAARKWFDDRHGQWQRWAGIAQISRELLLDHISALLEAEPMEGTVVSYMVTLEGDGCTLVVKEMLTSHRGRDGSREIWRRKFRSASAGQRAQLWLVARANDRPNWADRIRSEGPAALDAIFNARFGGRG